MQYEIQYKSHIDVPARGGQRIASFQWKGKALCDSLEVAKKEATADCRVVDRDTGEVVYKNPKQTTMF